ncbi:MAG: hypothetical protein K0S27_1708 [Gammaproteobacteria bacterium]|jgi:hypothetical protein|nr:hypothetical protein [Gammaproteobacteria bacterium]
MLNDSTLQAFSDAAGISASGLSLSIRTCLLSSFLMWASWCALELMKYHKSHHDAHIVNLLSKYIQLFFLISVIIALVFIP